MSILVFGGSGFIGSRFIKKYRESCSDDIINVDKLTYASDQSNLDFIKNDKHYFFYNEDINNKNAIKSIIDKHSPSLFINFAAETHVDNSIESSYEFIKTNVLGTQVLLDLFREYLSNLPNSSLRKFIQISTDEVYGDLQKNDLPFTESSQYSPKNPYAASKAAGDHLVFSYINTYNLPLIVTNCSNNYGPNQHVEKLIPKVIHKAIHNQPIPIYGHGNHIRDWIFVDDHCEALIAIINSNTQHKHYNIGSNHELSNIDLVNLICEKLSIKLNNTIDYKRLIKFVDDRPGHDYRYAINNHFIIKDIHWKPYTNFEQGISDTIDFFLKKYQDNDAN